MEKVAAERASGVKILPNIQMRYDHESISNRSWPGLLTTVLGVARQGNCENYATAKDNEQEKKERKKASSGNCGRVNAHT